ncbi:MAG TPA: hypothetical protein VMU76_09835 [Acidimicrobiales bacterium]|nr:hypothetical protein [Acidimicrobiales bacterium]
MARLRKSEKNKGPRRGVRESGADAVQMVIAYFKQETLEPLSGLGRFLLYGIAGSLAIAIGTVILLVAVLRLLQTETGAFHGNLSWVPYVIVLVLAAVIIALSLWRVTAGAARRRLPTSEGEVH